MTDRPGDVWARDGHRTTWTTEKVNAPDELVMRSNDGRTWTGPPSALLRLGWVKTTALDAEEVKP